MAEVGELKVASTSVANNEASAPVDSIFYDIGNLTAGNSVSYEEQNVGPRSESIINHADPFPIPVPDFTVSLSEGLCFQFSSIAFTSMFTSSQTKCMHSSKL